MNIISIGSDKNVFVDKSPVRERIIKYGNACDTLHVIVFTEKKLHFQNEQISKNVFVYPTSSVSQWLYIYDAYNIGKKISHVDMVTAQDPFESGLAGMFIARAQKTKLHIQIHTDFLSSFFRTSFLNSVRIYIANIVIPNTDCIRVVSNRIKDSIQKRFRLENTPVVLPIFVDIEKYQHVPVSVDVHKKYPQFDHIAIMVSRLEKEKDIERVLAAYKKIVHKYPKSGLIIIGEGGERTSLESAVKRLKIGKNVVFEGWQTDTVSYYKSADLFINSSLYEGYGLTLVEALASGTPVLSTDVGVAREVGADIFTTDEELLEKMSCYIEGEGKVQTLQNYPYKNEQEYLVAFKRTWLSCLGR